MSSPLFPSDANLFPAQVSTPLRRRDRHERGMRRPLLPPNLPGWRTRAENFDKLVADAAKDLAVFWTSAKTIQFAVEEVPPSDPAPWEPGILLGRGFDAQPRVRLAARVIIYRQPITCRAADAEELKVLVRHVVAEQVALMLGKHAEDLDPRFFTG